MGRAFVALLVSIAVSATASAQDHQNLGDAFRDCANCPKMVEIPAGMSKTDARAMLANMFPLWEVERKRVEKIETARREAERKRVTAIREAERIERKRVEKIRRALRWYKRKRAIAWLEYEYKRHAELGRACQQVATPGTETEAVTIRDVMSIARQMRPGTRVDILLNVKKRAKPYSIILLKNIRVWGIKKGPKGRRGRLVRVTVEATPPQARKLAVARKTGGLLSLALSDGGSSPCSV